MQKHCAAGESSDHKVTKAKVFAYVEKTFARADHDGDGSLSFDELEEFLSLLCHPAQSAALRQVLSPLAAPDAAPVISTL